MTGESEAPRERTLFVGGPWHWRDVLIERRPHINVPVQTSHKLFPGGQLAARSLESFHYQLSYWRTAAGEGFYFYCDGDLDRAGDVLRPVSEVLDGLDVSFGPNRLFLAIGLETAGRQFVLDLLRIARKHQLKRRR